MSDPKRAKFSHPQGSRVPTLEAPKTSEYAFFKKLRKDIGSTKCRTLHEENIQSKVSEENGQNRGTSTYSSSILRSSSNSEKEAQGTSSGFKQRSSLLCGDVVGCDQNLLSFPFAGSPKNSEKLALQNSSAAPYDPPEKDVFSVKRQRLRQLAADLFPEAGECNSKGFDLVSALLSRLLPRGSETEKTYVRNASKIQDGSCWDDVSPRCQLGTIGERVFSKCRSNETEYSNSMERMIGAEHPSAALPKLGAPESAFKIQDESFWDHVFPNYQSSGPRGRVLSKWDMITSDLPCIKYKLETDFQDEEASYNFRVDGGSIQYTFPESDSSFCVFIQNFRHSGAADIKQLHGFHIPELHDFHTPNEPAKGEARTLLLSWDVKDDKGKNSCSTSGNPLDFACQQIMDGDTEETNACLSSVYSSDSLDFLLKPYIHSTCTYMHDMRGNYQDDDAVTDANVFPLSLSLPPKHLSMEEDWHMFKHFENSNLNLPQLDPPWCSSEVPKKGDIGALLLSRGLDINLGWKCLPGREFLEYYSLNNCIPQFLSEEDLSSCTVEQDEETILCCSPREGTPLPSYDGALGILNCSSAGFNASLGKKMDHPLLLDYPDRIRSEEFGEETEIDRAGYS